MKNQVGESNTFYLRCSIGLGCGVVSLCYTSTDIDDFIVDDDGQPITKKRGKKFSGYTDA